MNDIADKGRGRLSVADIAYVATAHDFAWSKDELSDMVEFFDSNQDGMVSKSDICNSPDQQFHLLNVVFQSVFVSN
jgi:Ca2+-binding EF-hand superfamily protein